MIEGVKVVNRDGIMTLTAFFSKVSYDKKFLSSKSTGGYTTSEPDPEELKTCKHAAVHSWKKHRFKSTAALCNWTFCVTENVLYYTVPYGSH